MVYGEHYDCIYSATGCGGDSLDNMNTQLRGTKLSHAACFGTIYSQIRNFAYCDVTYKVYLYANDLPEKNFNLCDKLETKKILRCLQKTVPFTYKFEKDRFKISNYKEELTDYNVLVVHIVGNYAQHLWVTTMLRCFFEWPYNIAAKEACVLQSKIKEVDGFDVSKENWINLYLTIAAQLGSYRLHGIVDFNGQHPQAKTYQEWKQKLASCNAKREIIDELRKGGGNFDRKVSEKFNIYSQEEYNKGTQNRAAKYVAAYKDKLSWKKK